jgi:hypothetical protein
MLGNKIIHFTFFEKFFKFHDSDYEFWHDANCFIEI